MAVVRVMLADLLDQGPKHPERAVRAAFLLQQLQADLPFVLHAAMLAGQLIHAPLERLAEPEIVAVKRQNILADDRAIDPIRQGDFQIEHTAVERLARDSGFFRSEEHTSELQSLMRISYAVFCLKKKTKQLKTYRKRMYV